MSLTCKEPAVPPAVVIPGFRAANAIELYPTGNLTTQARAFGPAGAYELIALEYHCYLRISGCAVRTYGKFDTGAYISVIPRSQWTLWPRRVIDWLTLPAGAPPSWSRVVGVTGAAVPARLGVV